MLTPVFSTLQNPALIPSAFPTSSLINLGELGRQKFYFVDINSEFGIDGKREILVEEDAIKAQIRNILSTPTGSEPFEPEYGSLLPYRLFEPINVANAWNIENDTVVAIRRWMASRIEVTRQQVYVQELLPDESAGAEGYYIRMSYTITRTRAVAEYRFSLYK